jgi:triphosphoribosyl-dephospho-CoA synthase
MVSWSADEIAWAAQLASIMEVNAYKPGNVTKLWNFQDCSFEDFLVSAVAIGPAFRETTQAPVGLTILRAIKDTHRLVGTNTNLGITLLIAPLAKAAGMGHPDGLRAATMAVLEALTVDDACMAYEAIRLANPAGLGQVEHGDVKSERIDITLREAMKLAQERDTVAREYVTGFEITFELGYATLRQLQQQGHRFSQAILQTFITILAHVPDSLIARKNGLAVAEHVSELAKRVLESGGIFTDKGRRALQALDHSLRDQHHRMNPGTTADLMAASLFVLLTEGGALGHLSDLMRHW